MSKIYDFCKDVDDRIAREISAVAEALGIGPEEVIGRALQGMLGTLPPVGCVANNSTRQRYRVLDASEKAQVERIKELGAEFTALCHEIGGTDPEGERLASRDLSLAATHSEDAVMRAVRHVTK